VINDVIAVKTALTLVLDDQEAPETTRTDAFAVTFAGDR
jgi:hypothetical protein